MGRSGRARRTDVARQSEFWAAPPPSRPAGDDRAGWAGWLRSFRVGFFSPSLLLALFSHPVPPKPSLRLPECGRRAPRSRRPGNFGRAPGAEAGAGGEVDTDENERLDSTRSHPVLGNFPSPRPHVFPPLPPSELRRPLGRPLFGRRPGEEAGGGRPPAAHSPRLPPPHVPPPRARMLDSIPTAGSCISIKGQQRFGGDGGGLTGGWTPPFPRRAELSPAKPGRRRPRPLLVATPPARSHAHAPGPSPARRERESREKGRAEPGRPAEGRWGEPRSDSGAGRERERGWSASPGERRGAVTTGVH